MDSLPKMYVGIDVSKATLDLHVIGPQGGRSLVIKNDPSAVSRFFSRHCTDMETVVGVENTGRYNWPLYEGIRDFQGLRLHVIPPLHLKKSLGLVRGKNDKVDAVRIARFVEKHHDTLPVWNRPSDAIRQAGMLLAERAQRIRMKKQLTANAREYGLAEGLEVTGQLERLNREMVDALDGQIAILEARIEQVIGQDETLARMTELVRSIPGVGKVLGWMLLVKTNGFENITDPRKLACYAGVVPFDHQSGTSLRYRPKVSPYADKSLKSVLHLGAMSAIRLDNDLRAYYLRKVAEGKNKMSVINAVRNKIVHRVYAVIKNQRKYQNDLALS